MKIRKKPEHFPFVSPEQQKEGLEFITKHTNIYLFEHSMGVLVRYGFIRKAKKHKLLKRFRHIIGMSYDAWRRSR